MRVEGVCMDTDTGESHFEHRAFIGGIPHCPECGGMLWPPEYTEPVVDEDGNEYDQPMNAPAGTVIYHKKCFQATNKEEGYSPSIQSENESQTVPTK